MKHTGGQQLHLVKYLKGKKLPHKALTDLCLVVLRGPVGSVIGIGTITLLNASHEIKKTNAHVRTPPTSQLNMRKLLL